MFVLPDVQISEAFTLYEDQLLNEPSVRVEFESKHPEKAARAKEALNTYFNQLSAHAFLTRVGGMFKYIEGNPHFLKRKEGNGKFEGLTLNYLQEITKDTPNEEKETDIEVHTIQNKSGYIISVHMVGDELCKEAVHLLATKENAWLDQVVVNDKVAMEKSKIINTSHCSDMPFSSMRFVRLAKTK